MAVILFDDFGFSFTNLSGMMITKALLPLIVREIDIYFRPA